MTQPIPTDLDQAVITAGLALVDAERAEVRDEQAIAEARAAVEAAMSARWGSGA